MSEFQKPYDRSPLAPAFGLFAELLDRRFGKGVFTTEDSIRYTFFHALAQGSGVAPEQIVLEKDHGVIARAKLDMWIESFAGRNYAIEFKYDRAIPSGATLPLTQKAGKVVADPFRLARIDRAHQAEGIFIYVATHEMASYLAKPSNGLAEVFGLGEGSSVRISEDFLAKRSATLRTAAGRAAAADITLHCKRQLPDSHQLQIFGVRPVSISGAP